MGRRLVNFRSGDRAEALGVLLLQGTCAVAPIPRQEDFGLADALATLLRRNDRFVFAEDSFLVQFKSRTESEVVYQGVELDELRSQDMSVMLGQVNLRTATMDLYTLGPALAHPNCNDAHTLVLNFGATRQQRPTGLVDDVLHARLSPPVLHWSVAEVENTDVMQRVYEVLKAHLAIERWNRQQRLTGTSRQVTWVTNELPIDAGETLMHVPAREQEALSKFVPAIRALAWRGYAQAELREPMTAVMRWLARQGVDADPGGTLQTMLASASAQDTMKAALSAEPSAEVAITFEVLGAGRDYLNCWVHELTAMGQGSARRHRGSLASLREQGFDVSVALEGTTAHLTFGVTDGWLEERGLAELAVPSHGGTLLFRRLKTDQ